MFYLLDKLKPKTKTKIFFVGVNKNLTTFLYTFDTVLKMDINPKFNTPQKVI